MMIAQSVRFVVSFVHGRMQSNWTLLGSQEVSVREPKNAKKAICEARHAELWKRLSCLVVLVELLCECCKKGKNSRKIRMHVTRSRMDRKKHPPSLLSQIAAASAFRGESLLGSKDRQDRRR